MEAQRGSGVLQSAQTSLFRSRFDIPWVEMSAPQARQGYVFFDCNAGNVTALTHK